MARLTKRAVEASTDVRLARLMDSPLLERMVPHLPAETLHQLIRHRGLHACGELVTYATPAQLTSILDLDLWRHARPGQDHAFDVERFGEWLDVLVDTGESNAAKTVAAINTDVVIAGLSRYVRVFDPGIFEPTAHSDDEAIDRHHAMREGDSIFADRDTIGERLECEVGGYIVRARRAGPWDAIVALMIALQAEHTDYFHTVMRGCRSLSNSRPEANGFHNLFLAPEQHLHELALEREHRRAQQGFATPADARAFLEMARDPRPTAGQANRNPIVTAYFRAAEATPDLPKDLPKNELPAIEAGVAESVEAMVELLADAGVIAQPPRALLTAGNGEQGSMRLPHLRRAMAHVAEQSEATFLERGRELAFLANALLEGCSVQSRPFTPAEASDAAAGICNLGLELSFAAGTFQAGRTLIAAFERGWSALHHEVSLFTADRLITSLARIDGVDSDLRLELTAFRRTLLKHQEAGTPWRSRGAAEILAMIDPTVWISVVGLLDECPIMPATLSAILDGRTKTVSPTDFQFISSVAQIDHVRMFAHRLPQLLAQ